MYRAIWTSKHVVGEHYAGRRVAAGFGAELIWYKWPCIFHNFASTRWEWRRPLKNRTDKPEPPGRPRSDTAPNTETNGFLCRILFQIRELCETVRYVQYSNASTITGTPIVRNNGLEHFHGKGKACRLAIFKIIPFPSKDLFQSSSD